MASRYRGDEEDSDIAAEEADSYEHNRPPSAGSDRSAGSGYASRHQRQQQRNPAARYGNDPYAKASVQPQTAKSGSMNASKAQPQQTARAQVPGSGAASKSKSRLDPLAARGQRDPSGYDPNETRQRPRSMMTDEDSNAEEMQFQHLVRPEWRDNWAEAQAVIARERELAQKQAAEAAAIGMNLAIKVSQPGVASASRNGPARGAADHLSVPAQHVPEPKRAVITVVPAAVVPRSDPVDPPARPALTQAVLNARAQSTNSDDWPADIAAVHFDDGRVSKIVVPSGRTPQRSGAATPQRPRQELHHEHHATVDAHGSQEHHHEHHHHQHHSHHHHHQQQQVARSHAEHAEQEPQDADAQGSALDAFVEFAQIMAETTRARVAQRSWYLDHNFYHTAESADNGA